MTLFLRNALALVFTLVLLFSCKPNMNDSPKPNPAKSILAGLRASPYGAGELFNKADYWIKSCKSMAGSLDQAAPAVIWILGTMEASSEKQPSGEPMFSGRCVVSFPGNGQEYLNIVFTDTDQNELILDRFDQEGISVWLQVEPANADMLDLIDLILNRYKHHPSVIGFGIDVEWHRWSLENMEGAGVNDPEASRWLAAVKVHNPKYKLFLKHWLSDKMPQTVRQGLVFLDDSQMFSSLSHMQEEFASWGRHFYPAEVAFQYGYGSDRAIWQSFKNPARELTTLLMKIPNAKEFYWVDFTMRELWPD